MTKEDTRVLTPTGDIRMIRDSITSSGPTILQQGYIDVRSGKKVWKDVPVVYRDELDP